MKRTNSFSLLSSFISCVLLFLLPAATLRAQLINIDPLAGTNIAPPPIIPPDPNTITFLNVPTGMNSIVLDPGAENAIRFMPDRFITAATPVEVPGKGALVLQKNGLVCYDAAGKQVWASGTTSSVVASAIMYKGNLFVQSSNSLVWESGTGDGGASGRFLEYNMQTQGLDILDAGRHLIKNISAATTTSMAPVSYLNTGKMRLASGRRLNKGGKIEVPGKGALVMQDNGNLVFYAAGGVPVWSTQTSGSTVSHAIMQPDGNLCLFNGTTKVWESQTADGGAGKRYLEFDFTTSRVAIMNQNGSVAKELYALPRVAFARKLTYEGQICSALGMSATTNNTYANLPAFRQTMGELALKATELYFYNTPNMTPDAAIARIINEKQLRTEICGVLFRFVQAQLVKGGSDAQAVALRDWSTSVFRYVKIMAASGTLKEFQKWKSNPCAYTGTGYVKPDRCYGTSGNIGMYFNGDKPPTELIAKVGLENALSSYTNADEIAASVTTALAAITAVSAFAATTSGLGVVFAAAPGVASFTALYAAFAPAVTGSIGATGSAAIGATSWAGVVAAPIAAVVFAVVVGVVQGIAVVEAEMVEPTLKGKLGDAISEPIVIANEMGDEQSVALFLVGFMDAASHQFELTAYSIEGEVTFMCQAGYVSKFTLKYTLGGQQKSFSTAELPLGKSETFALPPNATNISASGYMISAGEHHVFTQTIAKPTYICFKTINTIFNRGWSLGWPVNALNEVTFFNDAGFVSKFQIDYKLGGQAQTLSTGEHSGGWKQTYTLPENATHVRVMGWGATGLAWEAWRLTLDKTYPAPPNKCFKMYGSTLDQKWDNNCN